MGVGSKRKEILSSQKVFSVWCQSNGSWEVNYACIYPRLINRI